MLKIVDHDLDIIVMSNGLGGLDLYTLVEAIIESCIPDLPQPEDVPAAPITGIFHSPQTGRRLALEAVGGKQAIRIEGMTLPARRDGEGRPSKIGSAHVRTPGPNAHLVIRLLLEK